MEVFIVMMGIYDNVKSISVFSTLEKAEDEISCSDYVFDYYEASIKRYTQPDTIGAWAELIPRKVK